MSRASFTADEVAAMHNVSPSHIRKLIAAGTLAKVPNLGRAIRVPLTAIESVFGPVPDRVLASFDGEAAA